LDFNLVPPHLFRHDFRVKLIRLNFILVLHVDIGQVDVPSLAPFQVLEPTEDIEVTQGWTFLFLLFTLLGRGAVFFLAAAVVRILAYPAIYDHHVVHQNRRVALSRARDVSLDIQLIKPRMSDEKPYF
jgi:hypothetical protein